jgi:hypothetical protein
VCVRERGERERATGVKRLGEKEWALCVRVLMTGVRA